MPCIIKQAFLDAEAQAFALTLDDIVRRVGEEANITVDVTPDGHGDCVRSVSLEGQPLHQRRMFVKPHERNMEIGKFRDLLRKRIPGNGQGGNRNTPEAGTSMHGSNLDVHPLQPHSDCTGNRTDDDEALFPGDTTQPLVVYYSRQVSWKSSAIVKVHRISCV